MKCIICDKEIERSLYSNAVLCSSDCFNINFWNELVRDYSENSAIIDGEHYIIDDENAKSEFRGFSGRLFEIEFFDGRVIETTNLWYQGIVPLEFRDRLPDNARFRKYGQKVIF